MINYKDDIPVEFAEDEQTILLQLLDHLGKKTEGSLMDYILDFCDLHKYKVEEVGFLIKKNKNIRTLLKEDCIYNGILRTEKLQEKMDSW